MPRNRTLHGSWCESATMQNLKKKKHSSIVPETDIAKRFAQIFAILWKKKPTYQFKRSSVVFFARIVLRPDRWRNSKQTYSVRQSSKQLQQTNKQKNIFSTLYVQHKFVVQNTLSAQLHSTNASQHKIDMGIPLFCGSFFVPLALLANVRRANPHPPGFRNAYMDDFTGTQPPTCNLFPSEHRPLFPKQGKDTTRKNRRHEKVAISHQELIKQNKQQHLLSRDRPRPNLKIQGKKKQ